MRKTSHDGADTSSITSGIDNETKKSVTNLNKSKKTSIKRKVENFSHESDDGIIEPLLQTEKEKLEIANRSAKYLLHKSKTESLHEKDNKVADGFIDKSVTTSISSTSNMTTNFVKETPVSNSYACGSTIHNHMNTNIFCGYEVSPGFVTTKNPILIEIDACKPGGYSPSPLIFTTAKIHTDSKTKLMEPVQVTPVPILSTIEGNIVKAGVVGNAEIKASIINKATANSLKNLSDNLEISVSIAPKDKRNPQTPHSFSKSESIHSKNKTKSQATTQPLEKAVSIFHKDVTFCQLSSKDIVNAISTVPKLTNSETQTLKEQSIRTTNNNINNIVSDKGKEAIESLKSCASSITIDNSKENINAMGNKNIINVYQDSVILQNQDNTLKSNVTSSQPAPFIFKDNETPTSSSITGSKKLLRQKHTSTEETSLVKEVNKSCDAKSDKTTIAKPEYKCDLASPQVTTSTITKVSNVNTTAAAIYSSKIVCVTTPSSTIVKLTPSTASAFSAKVKSAPEVAALRATIPGTSKDMPEFVNKSAVVTSQIALKDSKEPTTSSTKYSSTTSLASSKTTSASIYIKSDITSPSYISDPLNKCTDTASNATLPSYIVSTSKTKIGSTLTSCTPAVTSKPQTPKPLVNVNTSSELAKSTGAKSSASSSSANGTKPTSFSIQTKSKTETMKRDGRAYH